MKRKEILPSWIRFFSWFFLFMSIAPVVYVTGLITGFTYNISAFGLSAEATNSYSILATYLAALLTLSAVVAYGILWGKHWALKLGLVYGIIATLTSFYAIFATFQHVGFRLPLDPLLLIPFIWVLWNKRIEWVQYSSKLTRNCESERV